MEEVGEGRELKIGKIGNNKKKCKEKKEKQGEWGGRKEGWKRNWK